jgi:hypothetical protein
MQQDFFNNIAAIAVVLLFTKVVTHRLRRGQSKSPGSIAEACHVVTVLAATGAVVVALIATGLPCDAVGLYISAGVTLGVAGLLLILDELGQMRSSSPIHAIEGSHE